MPHVLRKLIDQAITWGDGLPNRIRSNEIFTGSQRVLIEHNAQIYELRVTRQNKLILTK